MGSQQLQKILRASRKEQQQLCADVEGKGNRLRRAKVAVDGVFLRRLLKILRV